MGLYEAGWQVGAVVGKLLLVLSSGSCPLTSLFLQVSGSTMESTEPFLTATFNGVSLSLCNSSPPVCWALVASSFSNLLDGVSDVFEGMEYPR